MLISASANCGGKLTRSCFHPLETTLVFQIQQEKLVSCVNTWQFNLQEEKILVDLCYLHFSAQTLHWKALNSSVLYLPYLQYSKHDNKMWHVKYYRQPNTINCRRIKWCFNPDTACCEFTALVWCVRFIFLHFNSSPNKGVFGIPQWFFFLNNIFGKIAKRLYVIYTNHLKHLFYKHASQFGGIVWVEH